MAPCHNCVHAQRGHICWSEHFRSCIHPSVQNGERGLLNLSVKVGGNMEELIEEGWFIFPFNYDPNWIKSCQGQTPRRE